MSASCRRMPAPRTGIEGTSAERPATAWRATLHRPSAMIRRASGRFWRDQKAVSHCSRRKLRQVAGRWCKALGSFVGWLAISVWRVGERQAVPLAKAEAGGVAKIWLAQRLARTACRQHGGPTHGGIVVGGRERSMVVCTSLQSMRARHRPLGDPPMEPGAPCGCSCVRLSTKLQPSAACSHAGRSTCRVV